MEEKEVMIVCSLYMSLLGSVRPSDIRDVAAVDRRVIHTYCKLCNVHAHCTLTRT